MRRRKACMSARLLNSRPECNDTTTDADVMTRQRVRPVTIEARIGHRSADRTEDAFPAAQSLRRVAVAASSINVRSRLPTVPARRALGADPGVALRLD